MQKFVTDEKLNYPKTWVKIFDPNKRFLQKTINL